MCEPHCQSGGWVCSSAFTETFPESDSLCLPHSSCVCEHGNSETFHPTPYLFLHISLTCTVSLTSGPSQNLFCLQPPIYFFPPIKYILLLINSAQSIDISWKRFWNSRTKVLASWGEMQINLWLLVWKYWVQEDIGAIESIENKRLWSKNSVPCFGIVYVWRQEKVILRYASVQIHMIFLIFFFKKYLVIYTPPIDK